MNATGPSVDLVHVIDSARYIGWPLAITILTILIMLVDGYDLQTMSFVAPDIVADWGIARADLIWVLNGMSIAMVIAPVPALRTILTAYDGWYRPIYMAEENTDPARTLPRAIIGGTLLVVALYLLINFASLHVLSLPVLTASQLPAADAARVVLPRGGTPRTALAITSAVVVVVILTGSFEQLIALSAVLFLIYYIAAFLAVFALPYRLPKLATTVQGFPLSVFNRDCVAWLHRIPHCRGGRGPEVRSDCSGFPGMLRAGVRLGGSKPPAPRVGTGELALLEIAIETPDQPALPSSG